MRRSVSLLLVLLLSAVGVPAAQIAGYSPASDNALVYHVRLGPGGEAAAMIVVLDESEGTGKGYDIAVADLDLDGKLGDQEKVTKKDLGRAARYVLFNLETTAPFGNIDRAAKYALSMYVFSQVENQPTRAPYVSAVVKLQSDGDAWEYRLSGSPATDPESSNPTTVTLGEPVSLDSTTTVAGDSIKTRVAIKDKNGLTMRGILKNGKTIGPHLTVSAPDGSTTAEKDMSYG